MLRLWRQLWESIGRDLGLRPIGLVMVLAVGSARAVVVRGVVTTPLGAPVQGARVQLILLGGSGLNGAKNVAETVSGPDGSYEIRADVAGRFLLLTTGGLVARTAGVQIGEPFYGGRTDLLTFAIALDPAAVTPQNTVAATLRDVPLAQLAGEVAQVRPDELLDDATAIAEVRQLPGAFVVQGGGAGGPARLYVRGGDPLANKVSIDGVSAEDLGGGFNFATLATLGFASLTTHPALELAAGAQPLYGLNAQASVVRLQSAPGQQPRPSLTYTGEAGSRSTVRNEAVAELAEGRVDALAGFSRFDTASEHGPPATPFHLASAEGDVGYHISGGTSLRAELREDVSADALASPFEFFLVEPRGRQAEQNVYGSGTFETRTAGNWHNLVRYGLARKRAETFNFATPATGLPVTITGANGASASGVATFFQLPARQDRVTDRDEYSYQTDLAVRSYFVTAASVRYESERGADLLPATRSTVTRGHLTFALGASGEVRHRLFYEASGFVDREPRLGVTGAPRVGLTFVPVRSGLRRFRGTTLHATAATGTSEPTLQGQLAFGTVQARSRTFDAGVEQNLLGQKLILRATYFHDQFSHQTEVLGVSATGLPALSPTLGYRAQGLETELRYQPFIHVLVHGGYTYLAALVEQSAAVAAFNPAAPGVAIGATTAVAGARPFDRPPSAGFFAAEYTGRVLAADVRGAFASRSDGTTGLVLNPGLLLPNRDLSPGYVSLDGRVTYQVSRKLTILFELDNLLDNRRIAPVGFNSEPFVARGGLRYRLGGE